MITSFEELGDTLAEIENRLSYLEMSQPYSQRDILPEKSDVQPEPAPVTNLYFTAQGFKLWHRLGELEGNVIHLRKQLKEYLDKPKKKKVVSYKY